MLTSYLIAGIAVSLGMAILGMGFRRRRLSRASRSWPMVDGRVTAASVEPRYDPDNGPWYELVIRYEYGVAGRVYTGSVISFANETVYSVEEGNARLAKYPVGAGVRVRVHPRRPGLAVLEPTDAGVGMLVFMGIGLLVVPIACLLFWT